MTGTPGRRKPSPSGGLLESVKQRLAVYEIIRELGRIRPGPVRFREIRDRLTPPPGSVGSTWRNVAAYRALKSLLELGWIGKTEHGYIDLKSPLYPLHGLRLALESEIERGTKIVAEGSPASDRGQAPSQGRGAGWSPNLVFALGPWLRAIDDNLIAREGAVPMDTPGPGEGTVERAARIAETLAYGYLWPEVEATLGRVGDFGKGWFKEMTSNPEALARFLASGKPPKRFRAGKPELDLKELAELLGRLKPMERELRRTFMRKGAADWFVSLDRELSRLERTIPQVRRQVTALLTFLTTTAQEKGWDREARPAA